MPSERTRRFALLLGLGGKVAKATRRRIDDRIAIKGAGDANDDTLRRHVRGAKIDQRIDADVLQRFVSAEDWAAKRLIFVERRLMQLEHAIIRRIESLATLLRDDALLFLQILWRPMRLKQDVGDEIERERRLLRDGARIVRRALITGRGVHVGAGILDRFGELTRIARARAFERHVLEQMRDAVQLRRLPARANTLPNAKRRRRQPRHWIQRNAHAIGKADEF